MEIINHEYCVSPEVAELLRKAGFDWEDYSVAHNIDEQFHWEIPLHIAQRWLREVKDISVDISSTCYSEYEYIIRKVNQSHYRDNTILALTACGFYTYEEAQEAGIKKALEMILEERK